MGPLAVSTGVAIAYGIALFAVLLFIPLTVTALKGHWLLFAAGWLTVGTVWWIAAFRLARPDSWWARHRYGPEKRRRAERRYRSASHIEVAASGE